MSKTMHCNIVLSQLDDLLDQQLKPAEVQQMQAHLGECSSCHQAWQQELAFRQTLHDHDVPAPAPGFEERAFAKLPNKNATRPHHRSFVAGFSGAIAAGVVLMIAAALFFNPSVQQPVMQGIQLTLHESKKVNMVFDVPEQVAEATFSMVVPEHVQIAGRDGLHQIEWKTALKKGKNLLSLPVVAQSMAGGELVAKIKYGNQEKVFRLKLDIQSEVQEQGMFIINNKAV